MPLPRAQRLALIQRQTVNSPFDTFLAGSAMALEGRTAVAVGSYKPRATGPREGTASGRMRKLNLNRNAS